MPLSLKAGDLLPFSSMEHRIILDKNYPFSVSYLNGHALIKKIQFDLKFNTDYQKSFDNYFSFMQDLANKKFWVKKGDNIITLSLLDLYQSFLQYLKNKEFEDQLYNSSNISMYGPMGPYQYISFIKLINDNIAKKIILYNIIKNKLPSRKFRLNLENDILIQYGDKFQFDKTVKLRQITENGFAFTSKDEKLLLDIEASGELRIYLSLNFLEGVNHKENIFYTDYKEDVFVIKQEDINYYLSYNSFDSNEVHFYCRFNKLVGDPRIFKLGEFVKQTEKELNIQLAL